ncbi:dienelactone hydrolase family protein [Amycolatopsis mongoliensis]|uniref:Dienelactone hydrolase family protein n=1 Tax=Amycolatopsis mongoliensis TaxID=715475 RepID=A0A9Y2JJ41_9PSEU|nr:dienelactone hydrolase family protein [Amycolatopsis sp. 4-36]WIX98326.1 dienelactone hydrolase family protein [Amycolatopsis sp. 4-36]
MGCNEHRHPRWVRPGPHQVRTRETAELTTADGQRVAVFTQEPETAEPKPVVVLCHGLGGSHRGYAGLGRHLASHGYAVLHPQFLDAFELAGPRLGLSEVDERTWAADPVAKQKMHALLFDPRHWQSRVARVHAVLDSLGPRSAGVLVAGHSYGAYTAQLLLGTRLTGFGLDGTDFGHPAVAGGILLSPQGSGDRGLTGSSWAGVERPLLVVTGTRDFGARGEGVAWRREPFDRARSAVKHLAVVRDGDHQLGGIPAHDDRTGPVAAAISAVAAAFADHVHGDRAAGAWLAAGPFPTLFEHTHQEETACPTS